MVIIFQHVPFEGPGLIGDMLEGRGMPHVIVKTYDDGLLPLSPAGFSAVIVMGGPMSANDPLPFLEKERTFIAEALDRGLPVLGVCLGAQILASVLGGEVKPVSEPEVGWGEVTLTDDGLNDPLFTGLDKVLPVLHWHGEIFDLPEGAVLLASSDVCKNQAFRWGKSAYGFQFHLEAVSEMVEDWISEDGISECGMVVDPESIRSDTVNYVPRTTLAGSLVFGRFLDLLRQ